MERLNPQISFSYWKVAVVILVFVAATSALSSKCYENQKMSRKNVLKMLEILRSAGEYSIRASQSSNPVTVYADTCASKNAISTVADFLSPEQVKQLASVDLLEMKEFISQQHKNATEILLKAFQEHKTFKPIT